MKNFRPARVIYILALAMIFASAMPSSAQDSNLVVRMARLKIDPAQLEQYKTALKEEIATSVRVEPGVLSLNAVADKNNPADITILEIYQDEDAYRKHLETTHFKKYKDSTKNMIQSLELVETTPVLLCSKTGKLND